MWTPRVATSGLTRCLEAYLEHQKRTPLAHSGASGLARGGTYDFSCSRFLLLLVIVIVIP